MSTKLQETTVLKGLIKYNTYFLKCMPRLKKELFQEITTKLLFEEISCYYEKYNKQPTITVLDLFVEKLTNITEAQYNQIQNICDYIKKDEDINEDWLSDATLSWIRERGFYEALIKGAEKLDKGELDTTLPEKLEQALSVSFDNTIGMEFSDADSRWDKYVSEEEHLPFDLEIFNKITNGGVCPGTLNIFVSSESGGFKSGTMCHIASGMLRNNKNVLYVSFEMSEDKIMERIDANLLDIPIDDLKKLGHENFVNRINSIATKTQGRLIVKQYPTSQCHIGHIRYLLKELKMKKRFKPDVIFLDYINIMASSRMKGNEIGNSYGYIKAISEEVRGLAVEQNVPIFSATQANRSGIENEDLSAANISESIGLVYTNDLLIGIITTPEFDAQNKICFKQLKNRYADKNINSKFFLGVDKSRMKLYELNPYYQNPTTVKDVTENEEKIFLPHSISARKRKIKL